MAVPNGTGVKRPWWRRWLPTLVTVTVVVTLFALGAVVLYVKSAADNSQFLVNYVNNQSNSKQLQQFLTQLHTGRVADCKASVQATADLLRASGVVPQQVAVDGAKTDCNTTQ